MKGWMIFLIVLVPVIAVVGFVVRGGGDYSSPKAAFESLMEAAKAQDSDAVKDCFTRETRGYFEELESITGGMGGGVDQGKFAQQFKGPEPVYGREQITGNQATLEVTVQGKTETVHFMKESGDWKISMPELKMAVQMMKGMGGQMQEMMEGMADAMSEAMEETMDEMGEGMQEMMEQMNNQNR
jgi:hypothetical protein